MTRAQYCIKKAQEAQAAIDQIVATGMQSGMASVAGASKSFTRLTISELTKTRDSWLAQWRRAKGGRRHGPANLS